MEAAKAILAAEEGHCPMFAYKPNTKQKSKQHTRRGTIASQGEGRSTAARRQWRQHHGRLEDAPARCRWWKRLPGT